MKAQHAVPAEASFEMNGVRHNLLDRMPDLTVFPSFSRAVDGEQAPPTQLWRLWGPGRALEQVVANGVNYFWRKVNARPALAHANGVGPKSYYLRLGSWVEQVPGGG